MKVVVVANFQELSAGKLEPLSVMMEFGTPNRWMMLLKNDSACSALRLVIWHASIHLKNLSMATNRWV
jgi:hypothetical protein